MHKGVYDFRRRYAGYAGYAGYVGYAGYGEGMSAGANRGYTLVVFSFSVCFCLSLVLQVFSVYYVSIVLL